MTRSITRLTFALCLLAGSATQADAQRATRSLDSPVQSSWNRRAPTRVFDALGRASGTTVWILNDASLPRVVTLKGEGRTARALLDALTKQLGMTWSEESGLVLVSSDPTDDPLRGKAGEAVVQGRTLRAWRVELCRARRTSRAATAALAKGGKPGLQTLVQAALGGPYRARYAASEALRTTGETGAALLLAQYDTTSRRRRASIESLLRRLPSASKIVLERIGKGTLAQRVEALRMLSNLRSLSTGFAQTFTKLLDDPQLDARERAAAGNLIARLLQYAPDAALPEAYTVWLHLRTTGDRSLMSQSSYGLRSLAQRVVRANGKLPTATRAKLLDQLSATFLADLSAPRSQRDAARSLALLAVERPKLLEKLVSLLESEADPRTQALLVEALGGSKSPRVVPILLKQLAANPTLERPVGSALSRMGPSAFPLLFGALKDPSPLVRRVVCRAFGGVSLRPRPTRRGERPPPLARGS